MVASRADQHNTGRKTAGKEAGSKNRSSEATTHGATWGGLWLQALKEASQEGARGLIPAPKQRVLDITFGAGLIQARIVDRHGEVFSTDVQVRRFSTSEAEEVVAIMTATAGHVSTMFGSFVPVELLKKMETLELGVIPGPSSLRPDCDCGQWAEVCKHVGTVYHAAAKAVDLDPLVLFELRGVAPEALLEGITTSRRHAIIDDPWEGWNHKTKIGLPPQLSEPAP